MTSYRFNTQKALKAYYSRGAVVSEEELRAQHAPIESLVRLKIISPIDEPKPKPKPQKTVELGATTKAKTKTRSRKAST